MKQSSIFFLRVSLVLYVVVSCLNALGQRDSTDKQEPGKWSKNFRFEIGKEYYSTSRTDSSGKFKMVFSSTGNLDIFLKETVTYSTNTSSLHAKMCEFDTKKGLIFYDDKGNIVWQKAETIDKKLDHYFLLFDDEGRLTIMKIIVGGPPHYYPIPYISWYSKPYEGL